MSATLAGPTVGLIAVTLPAGSEPLRHVWLDESMLMVGYDPARLTRDLVARLVREIRGADVTITDGVPA
ncbi:hypothetical protein [Kitasatospora sp. NPDC001175]|uniref:hypothetical protein n=1 Tax=Kitasatospora sp. NPDC001175 TaxID=3157103 RepID=UPI003CFD4DE5